MFSFLSCDMSGTVFTKRMETTVVEAGKMLGYSDLRENQVQIVQHFLSRKDVFVSLPSSSLESCYCILPYTFDSLQENLMALVVDEAHCQEIKMTLGIATLVIASHTTHSFQHRGESF